ncbi:MAG: S8 family serine peptidase, partial [Pseudobdellovibrionaceae bacterium]
MNRTKIKVLLFVSLSFSMPLWARALNQNSPKSIQENTQGITVAIIDTGVDAHHPLLQGSLWTNPGDSGIDEAGRDKSQNGIDDDGNGFVDDVHGWNFADNNNQLSDLHGHGTHIAGIIQRMSPKTNIMILKYYDAKASGAENLTNSVKAIRYAIQMKAKII